MTAHPRLLALAAIRTPDPALDDELATLAAGAPVTLAGLVDLLGGADRDADGDPAALAWCGYLVAARTVDESGPGLATAARLLRLAVRRGGPGVLNAELAAVRVQAAQLLGRDDEVERCLGHPRLDPGTAWAVRADRANPHRVPGADAGGWHELLAQPFVEHGVAPVGVAPGGGAPIRRLEASGPAAGSVRGPLVTVVMPTWSPDPDDLAMAVRSVAAQTWADLEILLCDDASPPAGARVVADCARLDPRVRVVTAERNGGAYAARDLGIAAARGELVTFNDADDWSHPERIERQVAPLLADPDVVCSLSWSLRATADLALTRLGRSAVRLNMSSSLYRARALTERLGGFDRVRKSADAELLGRAEAAYGAGSVVDLGVPLAVVQLTAGSLSRDDFAMAWTHPDRAEYKRSSRWWHDRVRGGAPARVEPGGRAPFPAPAYVRGVGSTTAQHGLALLADLDLRNRTAVDVGAEVGVLAEHAGAGGLLVVDGPTRADLRSKAITSVPALERRAARGDVVKLEHRQRAEVGTLVVRDPGSLSVLRAGLLDLAADDVLVVVDGPDRTAPFDPAEVTALLTPYAGRVRWLPTSPAVAADLTSRGVRCLDPLGWSAVDVADRLPERPGCDLAVAFGPVVDDLDRAAARALIDRWAVPGADGAPIRTTGRVGRLLGTDVAASDLTDLWDTDPGVLAELDIAVVVAADPDDRGVDVRVLRCLAAGCLVLADPATAQPYDGAVAAIGPEGTSAALDRLRGDAEERAALRRAGTDLAARRTAPELLAATARAVIASSRTHST